MGHTEPGMDATPARVLLATSVGLLVLATEVWLSGPDMFFGWILVVVVSGWSLVALVLMTGVAIIWRRSGVRSLGSQMVACAACLLACVLSVGVGLFGVPEYVRMKLSRGALIEAGEAVLSGKNPARAGLYGFVATSVTEGCAILSTGSWALAEFGWGYCPDGTPPSQEFEHADGPLFTYSRGFA